MRAFKCHFFRTHMIRKPSSSRRRRLHAARAWVRGRARDRARAGIALGFMCWVSSLITYAVEIFSAQHFMHVVPIYKSFLFVCLHLFVLNVAGYVAYTLCLLQITHTHWHTHAPPPSCSSAYYAL